MPSVCFYFQVHQPYRLKKYRFFDIGKDHDYFESPQEAQNNAAIFRKVANKSYLPTNKLLLDLLFKYPQFKISFSFSGVFLEQALEYYPEVIESFKKLVQTGRVEILAETYYHSLSFLYSPSEFKHHVQKHAKLIDQLFSYKPQVFRNTELIYNNDLAKTIEKMGYKGILSEGADHILGWRSSNFLYHPVGTKKIKLLLKNYRLSDDMAFRFSSKDWPEWPLTASKFAKWVNQINGSGEIINLFMDYETFGEHQWEHTGIFDFLSHLPGEILKNPEIDFATPTEVVERYSSHAELNIPEFVSWADSERDLSAWRSNHLQWDAFGKVYDLEMHVKKTRSRKLLEDWRRMQTSDHFYYMCTKFWEDGDVHKYFSPYESPYSAFIYYMNALQDLEMQVQSKLAELEKQTEKKPKKILKKSKSKSKKRISLR